MKNSVYIKEIFQSVQGEGPYVGYNMLFLRFSQCNLKCKYCDTDFKTEPKEYNAKELKEEINKYPNAEFIALTGGEPLCNTDFLREVLPLTGKKVYLETNGTLYKELEQVINGINLVCADIKLDSSSKNGDLFNVHEKFIRIAKKYDTEIFLKVVFNEKITYEEIEKTVELAKKYDTQIVLQPEMNKTELNVSSENIMKVFYDFISKYKKVRLIPQTHKFINVR